MDCRVKPGNDKTIRRRAKVYSRRDQRRIPAPQIVVGQVRAAPPTIDGIVPTKIYAVRENSLSELREEQSASLVGLVARPIVFLVEVAKLVIKPRYRGVRTIRQPFKQGSYLV